ncbi:carboxypeptidase-like regulatory domain-containing protein [uncultured Tenacibaculum sp.]|uniref:carboxypeptidase-like regulatory domain-containing protein n=1 Tax=uncultured Tenacibaculum sp. TaxID=174713 RepID=UPI002633BA7C|nr:carboxypeptidase-like regulatory domain-containing protein [uncultured Tenacibaculum sp.]
MKKLTSTILLFISSISFSQLKSTIIDSETKEGIPFVNIWIENENIGTSSNEKGEFELNINSPKTIVISAIGYETKKIHSNTIKKSITLIPQLIQLDEIAITTKKKNKKQIIGKFRKSKINFYFSCGKTPWVSARYFPYKENYNDTAFLDKIRILTNSEVKNAKFNIRLYGVNEKGEPEGYIHDSNIIGVAKKGKRITEVDISDLNIQFPEKGFFVAIEWLIIDTNKYEYKYKRKGSNKKHIAISYSPNIGTVPSETAENSWRFSRGQWKKVWKNKSSSKRYNNKYNLLAIELTLTN